MHALVSRFSIIALSTALLAGCQTTQPSPSASNPEPVIVSSLRQGGKGVPNGRSDSTGPYFRSVKLPIATDPGYGYSAAKPIKTGSRNNNIHILYLNSLRGPKGEPVTYERRGACCDFEDKSLPMGGGLLDVYDVNVDGSSKSITIYVDMYRTGQGPLQLPVGFTAR
jgi:hypothetical protein